MTSTVQTPREIKNEAVANFKRHFNSKLALFLKIVGLDIVEMKREGIHLWDVLHAGPHVDCFCSAGSFNVGRRNPEIAAALEKAMEECDFGDSLLMTRQKVDLAERLIRISPPGLDRVLFCSGGGEAIDSCLKIARGATGRPGVVFMEKGYHGHTGFALSAIGKDVYRAPFEPLMPEYRMVPFNDLSAAKRSVDERTAAVILELVQGEAGIHPASPEFVRGLRDLCGERGAMLVVDEVQTGFGRTGKMFCCEHYGLSPDLMAVAKSLGGSLYPIAAALMNERAAKFLDGHPEGLISTSGGSDLGCATGSAVIDYLLKHDVPAHAAAVGERLGAALEGLAKKHGKLLKEVRRKGLMIGLEYTHDMMGPMMSFFLGINGVMAIFSGNNNKVMRLMPPLIITEDEADRLAAAIDRSMRSAYRAARFVQGVAATPVLNKLVEAQEAQAALMAVIRVVRKLAPANWGGR